MISALEQALDDQMAEAGIPAPVGEYKAIEGRRFRWDFAWPEQKLLVECQGAIWVRGGHSTGVGITRDAEKINIATLNGWRTLIFTAEHIKSGQALEWVKQALS
jgi:hypothetical protein